MPTPIRERVSHQPVPPHHGSERATWCVGLLFISPWIVGFLAFLVYPIIYTLRISFTRVHRLR